MSPYYSQCRAHMARFILHIVVPDAVTSGQSLAIYALAPRNLFQVLTTPFSRFSHKHSLFLVQAPRTPHLTCRSFFIFGVSVHHVALQETSLARIVPVPKRKWRPHSSSRSLK